jgi:hypothetical protein
VQLLCLQSLRAAFTKIIEKKNSIRAEWFAACKGREPAICNFDVAGPLTEIVLLGNIAIRAGKELCWDGENMRTTNDKDANYLKEY